MNEKWEVRQFVLRSINLLILFNRYSLMLMMLTHWTEAYIP